MADEVAEQTTVKKKTGFFQKLLILFLLMLFVLSIGAFIITMDFIGMINLRDKLPESVKRIPLVQEYDKKVRVTHMSEEERLKYWIKEQDDNYIKQQAELKKRENDIENKMKDLIKMEKSMETKKDEWDKYQQGLKETQQELETLENKKKNIQEGIKTEQLDDLAKVEKLKRLSTIYEKMKAENAALTFNDMDSDLAIDLLMSMKESKAAEIMNFMLPEKVKTLAEKLKTKGAWKGK